MLVATRRFEERSLSRSLRPRHMQLVRVADAVHAARNLVTRLSGDSGQSARLLETRAFGGLCEIRWMRRWKLNRDKVGASGREVLSSTVVYSL